MSKSQISEVIAKHGLKAGDTMRNVYGDEIEGSTVIDRYTFVHKEDGAQGGWRMIHERPLHGDEMSQYFTDAAMRALTSIKVD